MTHRRALIELDDVVLYAFIDDGTHILPRHQAAVRIGKDRTDAHGARGQIHQSVLKGEAPLMGIGHTVIEHERDFRTFVTCL